MSFAFHADRGLIIVRASVTGPRGIAFLRLAVDTGATQTLIGSAMLVSIGYDPATALDRVEAVTGSGVEFMPRLPLSRIEALGRERSEFTVLCHTLPQAAGVDGLLGLDFFRGCTLTIDFSRGIIALA